MFKLKIFFSILIFSFFLIGTSIIKNKTRQLEKNIDLISEKIHLKEKDLNESQLDFSYLVSPSIIEQKINHLDNEEYLTAHGRILALGDLAYRDRKTYEAWKGHWPKKGDRITYGKYAGQKLTINGVKLLLLNDDEITSIIPEDVSISAYVEQR